jgi:hypothetical protein
MAAPALRSTGASRSLGEGLAEGTAAVYRHAEMLLIQRMAKMLKSGDDTAPDWAERKLAAIRTLRSYAENVIAHLDGAMNSEVEQALVLAYERGGEAALAELGRMSGASPQDLHRLRQDIPGAGAINRLIRSAVTTLRGTHLRILRWTLDTYRAAVGANATGVLLGTHSRLRAAQVAWEELITRGITGFVDRAGRRWELASYVEMAMRSTAAQAAVEGHLDRLRDAGIDLVIVSNAPQECVKCRPWEGAILSRGGAGARYVTVQHATDDRPITVYVAGSVNDAIAAGLMHPNCRHSLSAYLPGVTKLPTRTADPQGDADRQELRRLERKVREWKRREEGALTPQAERAARAKVRDWQAQIRAHVADTGLHRQPHREQIGQAR